MVNVTTKDIFNAQTGKRFKEAGTGKVEGRLTGYAVYAAEDVDKETGEVKEKLVSLMKVDDKIYSGESRVIAERLKSLHDVTTEEEITAGLEIEFFEFKAGRGMATTFLLK